MKRGEIWLLRDDGYATKPRPVVIIQSDELVQFQSVVLCLLTSFDSSNISTRVRVEPNPDKGLTKTSWVMTDKITTVPKEMLQTKIGSLNSQTLDNQHTTCRRSQSRHQATALNLPSSLSEEGIIMAFC